jgi:hypothetical protein
MPQLLLVTVLLFFLIVMAHQKFIKKGVITMAKREICGFIFIRDELNESVLCEVSYDKELFDFIAKAEFGSGDQIIAGINDTASDRITDELLGAIKNQLESQHAHDPRLVGMVCGQEASYILYANMKFSKQSHSGASETLSGEYYLADADE